MSMVVVGRLALALAGLSALYTVVVGLWAYTTKNQRLMETVRGSALAVTLSLTVAVLVLEFELVTGNFSVWAVFQHTNRALPLAYRLAALWGGDSGSVLFWGWILSLYTGYAATFGWAKERRLTPLAVPLLGALLVFFTAVSNFGVDPFRLVPGFPTNGGGLDPLLQNPVMTIHPPAMYTGLIGMAVPFAFMMSGLWQRIPSRQWTPVARRWLLFCWMFLGAAIVLGGWWAYMELGWGGYWEWDPVENASLLPWLAATAALHTFQVDEKRGMLKIWNAAMMAAAFLLTLVGTYITRSGVLKNSVHSFAGTGVGPPFMGLFWGALAVTVVALILRRDQLVDRLPIQDNFSREGAFFLQTFLMAVLIAVVLFGTFYPVISKAFMGTTVVLQIGFFNSMTVPLFLGLILLMGVGPILGWRSAKWRDVMRRLRWPWIIGIAGGVAAYLWGAKTLALFLGDTFTIFALAATVQQFLLAASVRRRVTQEPYGIALVNAVRGNRRRFGGYIAHVAFLIIALGVIGSHTGNYSVTRTFQAGQTRMVGPYRVTFTGLEAVGHSTYQSTNAHLLINGQGFRNRVSNPGLEFFPGSAQPVAHVSIMGGWWQDLYAVMDGYTPGGKTVDLQFFINPMVSWIWIGMYILVLGSLVAMGGGPKPPGPEKARRAVRLAGMLPQQGDEA